VGSGRDLLSAYLFGFRDVTGVELNPIFIEYLQNPRELKNYAGIANLPGVHLVVDEGRSWFARTTQRFDVIQMTMIDSFAATGAGAFSLSENGLYTAEAWKVFLSALNPDGVFTISRWHSPESPVEIGRVVSLAMAALFSMGVQDPASHIFLASHGNLGTIIIGRSRLNANDVRGLDEAVQRLQYTTIMSPDGPSQFSVFRDLGEATEVSDLNARAARYPLDFSPPTDSRPFFFNQLRISHPRDVIVMLDHARPIPAHRQLLQFREPDCRR
jgi:predicted membrane-bound spermidine synthase